MLRRMSKKYFRKIFSSLIAVSLILLNTPSIHATTGKIAPNDAVTLTSDFIINSSAAVHNDVICFSRTTPQNKDLYKCETLYIVPKEDTSASSLLSDLIVYAQNQPSQSRASMTIEEFDPSISIEGWLCTYYSKISSSYGTASKVTSVSGGYTKSDRSVSVTQQTLNYGSTGKSSSSGYFIQQSQEKSPSGNSWSYTAPTSWHHIVHAATHNIGANCTFDLKRYGSTWSFTIDCIISEG